MKNPRLTLTKLEKQVLIRKYMSNPDNPLSWEQAQLNIESITKYLENLTTTLKTQNKPLQEIESKFKQEFEKICMKAEAGELI